MKLSARLAAALLCLTVGSANQALAQDFKWQANAYNDPNNRGKYTAYLTQAVPETDNVAFRASCQPGSSARFAPTILVYNTGSLPRNTKLSVSFFVDGQRVHRMRGLVYHPDSEEGIAGIFLRARINDPLWELLASNSYVRYEANNMGKAGMHLSGSRQAIERFRGDCRRIFGINATQPAQRPTQPKPRTHKVRYNCQNGPQMTVIYRGNTLRYVYDGPDSAMRTMRAHKGNRRHFKDGPNSITLEPNRGTVDYREGNDLYDRCKAF
ncbi:MAG: hypothetical protein RIC14_08070 [Filomicrobium sp.]